MIAVKYLKETVTVPVLFNILTKNTTKTRAYHEVEDKAKLNIYFS